MHKTADLRTKDKNDLVKELLLLRKEQFNLRMQKGAGSAVKTHRFKVLRATIARVKTVIAEKTTERG